MPWRPFTVPHFKEYCSRLVMDDGERRSPEPWQLDFARDMFKGVTRDDRLYGSRGPDSYREGWLLVPEGNGKTTFVAQLALYGADYTREPWIPVGASARDQAKVLYTQASRFVKNTPGMARRFNCLDGRLEIRSLRNGGPGIIIRPWDPDHNDGVIPNPYAICDELHRHDDLTLYHLWTGKLRKKGAQMLVISTAGEPGTEFEATRDEIRDRCKKRTRKGGRLRAEGHRLIFHEFALSKAEDATDPRKVKRVNPLSTITVEELADALASPTFDIGSWRRLVCNIPTRSAYAAITDVEWDRAAVDATEWLTGARVDLGCDVAWKHDTWAFSPLWKGPEYHLLGASKILLTPRDGSSLHPDNVKRAFFELVELNPVDAVVMDMERAEDIAAWLEDECGVHVVDRPQSNELAVADYDNFMEGLRNLTLRHTGHQGLRRHAMNAIARSLPNDKKRFDRPSQSRAKRKQDVRVIDALVAAGFVYTYARGPEEEPPTPLVAVRGR